MKIDYIKGDLFSTPIKTIAHGCNAQGVMGAGVARIIRERYPEAYQEYKEIHEREGLVLGTLVAAGSKGKVIINAITQNLYGKTGDRFASYDAIDSCFHLINLSMALEEQTHVAMPMIGAGLGGGKWEVIAEIIEHRCRYVRPVVYQL